MNESLRIFTQRITKLPTIPPVADRIIQLVSSKASLVDSIVQTIEKDPAIAAKVISFSNAAFYRTGDPVITIRDAVMKIGFDNIKSIALAISLLAVFRPSSKGKDREYARIFRHCLAVGVITKEIADYLKWKECDDAFMSGLLHDLGLLVMHIYFPEISDRVYELTAKGKVYAVAEMEVCGFTHSDVGAWLADKWNLPENIYSAIQYHHNICGASEHLKTAAVVHVADHIAINKGYGPVETGQFAGPLSEEALGALGMTKKKVAEIETKLEDALSTLQEGWL
jgi:putative nucleotidyltransferase with HDIG domain